MAAMTALYASAVILKSGFWSQVLAPVDALCPGAVLLYSYIKGPKNKRTALLLLILAASLSRALGGILSAVFQLQGRDGKSLLISCAYLAPTVLFAAGTLSFCYFKYSKWRSMKGLIESLTIGVLSIIFIRLVIFNNDVSATRLLMSNGVFSIVAIIIDVFICTELLRLFFSEALHKVPVDVSLCASGAFLYLANDLVHYFLVYKKLNEANNFSGLVFSCAFMLIAAGVLRITLCGPTGFSFREPEKGLNNSKWLYLLAFPVISVAAGSARFIDLLIYAVIIGLYHASVSTIRIAKDNEALYKNEINVNERLEKRLEEQLAEIIAVANQDTITKLYNRHYFSSYIQEAVNLRKNYEKLAVLQFDVDRFKTINDSYGHDVGDKVIEVLSNRLTDWNCADAVLARLGGDEFAVMLKGALSQKELSEYSRQIIGICSAPIFVDHHVLYLTISIGLSVCPDDACDSITLMKNADIAMYAAKAEGYNKYVFYSPLFKENITRKNEIEALLRKADLSTDFELVFQPQFDLPDERLIGAEALIRWKSAEHGYIPPSIFIPVAEEIDYINKIGKWVMLKAVDQIVAWNNKYAVQLKMGINISPKQLTEDDFFITLKTLITTSRVRASWIDAEITENLMIEEKSKVKTIFDLFEELDISVSIDDFGSGYSSLGYLNKYHFDRIKIDKSLIDNLAAPGDSGVEVVKAIIMMANAVGKTTIAEGVETQEQLKILNDLGCRQVQGYLLGKPVPAEVFAAEFIEKDIRTSKKTTLQTLKPKLVKA